MRIGLIGSPASWYARDLIRAAGGKHEISAVSYREINACISRDGCEIEGGGRYLMECDAVLLRSMASGSLEQVIFRMDALAVLEEAGVFVLNSPRSMEVAIDKYLASARLAQAGLPTPATHVSQDAQTAMEGFRQLGGDVVLKPIFGGEGRGITRVSDEELAMRAFKMLANLGAIIYQQKFITHRGYDLRLLVLGEQVWGMRRSNPHDWRTNVSRGATTTSHPVDQATAAIARKAASSMDALFAGVDLLESTDGSQYVLEVNAVPGWRALATTLGVDISRKVLEYLEQVIHERAGPGNLR